MRAVAFSVVAVLSCFAAASASASAAKAPTRTPGRLVVAVNLPAPGFQVGAVKGSTVVYARGLEIELVRAIARRLGVRSVSFVQVNDHRRLLSPGAKRWDLAVAQVPATDRLARRLDLSAPYYHQSAAVLLARGVERPRSLAELRTMQLCVVRGTLGARAVAGRVRPTRRVLRVGDETALLRLVQTGRCDAAVHDAHVLGLALASVQRGAYGALAARVETDATFAIALPKNSRLTAPVDQALRRLQANGKLGQLARAWLGLDPSRLRPLR